MKHLKSNCVAGLAACFMLNNSFAAEVFGSYFVPTNITALEVSTQANPLPADYVITGIGFRAKQGLITTMRVVAHQVVFNSNYIPSAYQLKNPIIRYYGTEPYYPLEVWSSCTGTDENTLPPTASSGGMGVGLKVTNGDVTVALLACSNFNVTYGTFSPAPYGGNADVIRPGTFISYEQSFFVNQKTNSERAALNGFGARENSDNVSNIWGQISLVP